MGTSITAVTDALAFLDGTSAVYDSHSAAWAREERRLDGSDAVLTELTQFVGESVTSHDLRKASATYVNFARSHAASVTGHLRSHAPEPGTPGFSYAGLGEIRGRGPGLKPTPAELLHYNADGVGIDGSPLSAFIDAVDERAQATGHRWLMVESPDRPLTGSGVTLADVLDGARPYVIEFSPLSVPAWLMRHGQLQYAVLRVPTEEPTVVAGALETPADLGYYVLVRQGCTNLGPEYADGGWWLYDPEKSLISSGDWAMTRGRIPMWMHYGARSLGTHERPAVARSDTMELGQIGVALMNLISARDFDAWDAGASRMYVLGATDEVMQAIAKQNANRAIIIGIPAVQRDAETSQLVQLWDSSMGAVPAEIFFKATEAKYGEAREQSIRVVSATPDSSGRSKEIGFAMSGAAPFLARRAQLMQGSMQNLLTNYWLRSGAPGDEPTFAMPTKFDLAPLVDDIDAMFSTLRQSSVSSGTLETKMLLQSVTDRRIVTETDDLALIGTELAASVAERAAQRDADLAILRGEPERIRDASEGGAAGDVDVDADMSAESSESKSVAGGDGGAIAQRLSELETAVSAVRDMLEALTAAQTREAPAPTIIPIMMPQGNATRAPYTIDIRRDGQNAANQLIITPTTEPPAS